jgi:hypothetical protein
MPKKGSRAEINTFIQGLITEASPLNFPANASLDEDNFELNHDGTRDRRLGLDLEETHAEIVTSELAADVSLEAVNTFKWSSVNGLINQDFIVTQVNKKLYFFDVQSPIISTTGYKGTVTLSSLASGVRFSFAALEGKLIVASGAQVIAVVTYNSTLGTFAASYERLKVRDVWGVEVPSSQYETDVSFRGTTLPVEETYNLHNQSWGIPRKKKGNVLVNPISHYFTDLSVYPSNSEVVWAGMRMSSASTGNDPYEYSYSNLYTEALGSNVKAAKGYFIIDLLARGASRTAAYATNITKYPLMTPTTVTLPQDESFGGATNVEAFAGRVFYSGFSGEITGKDKRSPVLSDHIVFSSLVRSYDDIFKCYQEGDPTSRESLDLVDTDGGFIRISGAEGILGMRNIQSHLLVFAYNGVWAVSGGSDYGFSAGNYKVTKISNFGGITEGSIVTQNDRVFYWAQDGIYVIAKNQYGELQVQSLTDTTIKTYYENLDTNTKENCKGTYDPFTKKIRWLYKENDLFASTSVTKELIFDITLTAFYPSTIQRSTGNTVEVVGSFISKAFTSGGLTEPLFAGTDLVYAGTELVGVSSLIRKTNIQSIRYFTLIKVGTAVKISFAYFRDTTFADWATVDGIGVDAKAFLLTGSQTAGDSALPKQVPYLVMHFLRTEFGSSSGVPDNQSSCLVRSQWDWANTIKSNKWSPNFQAYRYRQVRFVENDNDAFDNGFETVVSKNKLRGRGRAFAMYLESEPFKDLRILGWNLTLNANTTT